MHTIRIPIDQDLQNYPHVFFTSPEIWDASVLDHEITPSLLKDINQHSEDSLLQDSIFDEYGDLHHRAIHTLNTFCDIPSLPSGEPLTHAYLHDSNPAEEDWKSLRPYFGWQSEQVIKNTYQVTSRFGGTIPQHDYLKKHFKSRNPVFNIPRRNEAVATDTIFSDTPAINDGSTMAQFFVGRDTLVCDAYGIKTQKQFINTLYDNIRFRGAMTTLITDGVRYEISKKVADLLRSLFIKQHESEPYHQHQNKAEQRYGVVKRYINTLMNLTGAPAHCWLLCMLYVCHLLNATASPVLGGLTPLQAMTAQVPDISHFLHFSFWEPIYYKVDESEPDHRFPSQSNEKRGQWVGFAENKGDQITWKIHTDDTNTIIIRSAFRSATKTSPNLRLDPPQGENQPQDLTSDVFVYGRPNPDGSDNTPPMSIINFDDLLGRTFLLPMDENGERKRATISEHVKDLCQQQVSREDQLRFKLKINGDPLVDLISYNLLMEYLEDKTDTGPLEDGLYRFICIKDHKGPYTSSDPEYNGSSYNLLIEWEPGEHVLEMSSAPTTLVERDKLDLSNLIPPKWTCPFKSPTSSTLCFGEPTLGKLNQETDFYMTKHMPKPSSEANRVSVSHSSLVTKNWEHFYGENFTHDFLKSWQHIKEVDWGDKLKLNYTTYGYMLMEIDWGGKFNYTSCGYPMANWQGHETQPVIHAYLHDSNPAEEDWKSIRPYFGWQSEQVIKNTNQVTSRFGGTIPQHDYLKKHFKSRNPVFNIPRRNEAVATDTIFSDTPAINDGSTMAQFFVGRDTLVCDAYGIKTQRQFINTLYDNIRFRGAMTTLITDGVRYEISKKVADLLRSLFIKQHESEPYHQHQNKAEQRYGVVKRYINTLMNLTGAPAHCWLLCMLYVCHLLNATASPVLGGLTPLQAMTAQVPDISHFLHFSFWEPIYYKVDESEPDHRFPSQSNEKRGQWVGFAENKGDQITWKIHTDDTNTIIIRSAFRSATKTSPNLRLDPPQGENQPQDLTSDVFVYGRPNPDGSDNTPPMSIINFDDLLGRTFLLPMDENGERKRATISEHVKDFYQQQVSREDQLRFKLKINGDQLDDLISYYQLMEYLEDRTDTGPLEDGLYRF